MSQKLFLIIISTVLLILGASAEGPEFDWKAQWIWQKSDGPKNTWIALRKEVDLKKLPETAIAKISTDTKYWLWINGEMVLFEGGLARGPHRDGSLHMEWIIQEAIMLTGDHAASLKRMRERYQPQVDDKGLTTFCEKFEERRGTVNHAWNAPNYVLSRYIAGIAADEEGWKSYHVLPNLAHLTSVKQVVPSVQGKITFDIELADGIYNMDLVSPEGTTAVVGIPKASITPKTIRTNGSTIWENGAFVGKVTGITWDGEDENHIKFKVAPGTWTIAANPE